MLGGGGQPTCGKFNMFFADTFWKLPLDIETIGYTQWESSDRDMIRTYRLDAEDFSDFFVSSFYYLKKHDFVARQQSEYAHELKKNLENNHALVIMDYAENYTVQHSAAIQSVYYNERQISLLTCVIYMDIDGQKKHESIVVLSDYLQHSTGSVYASYTKIFEFLKEKYSPTKLQHVHIKTDGCAGIIHILSSFSPGCRKYFPRIS